MLQVPLHTPDQRSLLSLLPRALHRTDVPDALFATDNDWGVPVLNPDWQAHALSLPATRWGSVARTSRMPGTWHFYTDDYRFDALWRDPTPIVNSRCVAVVEPNFSTNDQMPPAVALYRTYQKRWLARFWQTCGVRILVDLNVSLENAGLNWLGVPIGWRAYATRGYSARLDELAEQHAAACNHARTGDIVFVVYGGGKAVQTECRQRAWVWLAEEASRVRGRAGDG